MMCFLEKLFIVFHQVFFMKQALGRLFIVATPIGNLDDISHRATHVLSSVSLIAAEDTRHSKKLLSHLGIRTPIISLHAHNEKDRVHLLLSHLSSGKEIALISDAGTPLISDPGQNLVHEVHLAGFEVVPIPGPCALITALSAAGLPASRFIFEGFLPVKSGARIERLRALKEDPRTVVLYESPHRILALLKDMQSVLGEDRYIVLGRELTKLFETIKIGSLSEIYAWILENKNQQKGEFVLVVQGAEEAQQTNLKAEHQGVLKILLEELPLNQAVKLAARITGESKNCLYAFAVACVKSL